jgi:hypothetical protein
MVMLSARARAAIDATTSTSFACDLKKWLQIMEAYEKGGHAYHATMPTDALMRLREVMQETRAYGFEKVKAEQATLGAKVRALFESRGIRSVAAEGFKAPGVVVVTPLTPTSRTAKNFWHSACKPPPACRCNVTNRLIFQASASVCLVWKNCTTRTAAWPTWRQRSTPWASLPEFEGAR